ncbi:MAG TPA: MFS transporter [Thermoguttaceae bacterium]|nr:MFS transporter [Thermoguttaceae bacterium]
MNTMNQINERIGKYRWTICGLLFFATTVNYLDRQVLSLLKGNLEVEFNWTDTDYANIVTVFQLVYAISMLFAGRIIDWLGTKAGYAWSLIIWSVGAMLHALAGGTGGFMFARAVLGFGESGNFPAAIKATAQWFPKKDRSLATGIFNSGTNVGAILAPITVPWLAEHWGWQGAFIIVGAAGFSWLIFWFWLYDSPAKQKRLGKAEYDYIHGDLDEPVATNQEKKTSWLVEWGQLLRYRQTWAFASGKFLTDGVWWFFLFWLPAFLKAQYGMTGTDVMYPLVVLYTMTCVGSIAGGWFPLYFIKRGYDPYGGRMRAMFVIALFPLVVLLAQPLGYISYWVPVLLIGIGASAHQAWSANVFTTVSDMFPKKAVASVTGIGGMVGGLGSILLTKLGGWLFDAYRFSGIAKTWAEAKTQGVGDFLHQILAMKLENKHGSLIDLNRVELGSLPQEAAAQLQAINPQAFAELKQLQIPLVQSEMGTAYMIMFAICALAYLAGWTVMKLLVPRYKRIENL